VPTREVTLRFEVPEVYRLVLRIERDGTIREARAEGEFVSRQVGRLVSDRYRDPHKALYVVERLCGACSHAHTLAFASAVESALSLDVPPRATAIRALTAELERIQSHLFSLSETATIARGRDVARPVWAAWQQVTALLAEITGNRIHYGMNCIGGLARDLPPTAPRMAREMLASLGESLRTLRAEFEPAVGRRLAGLGVWRSPGQELPGTGPNQRASGSPRDVRRERPYLLYRELPLVVPVRDEGDSLARVSVRLDELLVSYTLIDELLASLPEGAIRAEGGETATVSTVATSMSVEAPRGEDRHEVTLAADGEISSLAIRVPTEDTIVGLAAALIGVREVDARLVVASFDLCMSCLGGT